MEEEKLYEEVENAARDDGDEWAFGEEVDFTIPTLTHNIWPRINQGARKKTASACTMAGALGQIIRLFGIDLTTKESNDLLEEVVDYCSQYGYTPGYGRDTPTAINTVVKWRNEIGREKFNKEKVFWARYYWNTERPQEALKKGHMVGFTYALNFGEDKRKGLVYKDSYPSGTGHRTNWQSTATTIPTGGAKEDTADCGVYDSYFGLTNQYLIRARSKYMNKGMYAWAYLILRESDMGTSIEEAKDTVAETKAINYVLGSLTTAWASVPEKYQEKFAALAKEIREDYKDARKLEEDSEKKQAVAVTDAMSYLYKRASEEEQKTYAELASKLRGKYDFK